MAARVDPESNSEQNDSSPNTVVVGAGAAGTALARAWAAAGPRTGHLTLIDSRADPVELPPLSKSLFDPEAEPARLWPADRPGGLADGAQDGAPRVRRRTGTVTRIDESVPEPALPGAAPDRPAAGAIHLDDGTTVTYDVLVLATGMRPRPVPAALDGVRALRIFDADSALAARAALGLGPGHVAPVRDIGVLGSGYLALEMARAAAEAGAHPTVHLRGQLPVTSLSTPMRLALCELHSAAGVAFAAHDPAPAAGAHALWLVATGAVPALPPGLPDEWQRTPQGHLLVDRRLRVAGAGGEVYAIGDIARLIDDAEPAYGSESLANGQGAWLGTRLAERAQPAGTAAVWCELGWHWSFQGPLRLFTVGEPGGTAETAAVPIVLGDLGSGDGQVLLFGGADPHAPLTGVETLGAPAAHNAAKKALALAGDERITRAEAASAGFELKRALKARKSDRMRKPGLSEGTHIRPTDHVEQRHNPGA